MCVSWDMADESRWKQTRAQTKHTNGSVSQLASRRGSQHRDPLMRRTALILSTAFMNLAPSKGFSGRSHHKAGMQRFHVLMDSDNSSFPSTVTPDLWPPGVTQLLWVATEHGERVRTGAGLRGNVNFGLRWNESMRTSRNSTLFGFLVVLRDGNAPLKPIRAPREWERCAFIARFMEVCTVVCEIPVKPSSKI